MKKEPNRFRGLYGAGRAAEAVGDRARARAFYQQLLDVASDADSDRPELLRARAFVGGQDSVPPRSRESGSNPLFGWAAGYPVVQPEESRSGGKPSHFVSAPE